MLKGSKPRFRRRGAVAALVIVMLTVLIGFVALAVDTGYICANLAAAQNSADAAALAGALALREQRWQDARSYALDCIARNPSLQGPFTPADQVIELGRWDPRTRKFTALTGSDAARADACHVIITEKKLGLFFGGFMRKPTTRLSRQAIAVAYPPCKGIWSFHDADVSGGGTTGSYDSSQGPYNPLALGPDGDICSCQNVVTSGDSLVGGDVGYGVSYTDKGNTEVTGAITPLSEFPPKPTIDMNAARAKNDNAKIGVPGKKGGSIFSKDWNLSLNSQGLTLEPGTYYFDSMKVTGTSTITIKGPTTIYVNGDMDLPGGFFKTTRDPKDLTIYCTGTKVVLNGGSNFFGLLVAPDADTRINGSGVLVGGLIVDNLALLGGAQICVDDALPLLSTHPTGSYLVQ